MGEADGSPDVAVQRPWRIAWRLSSFGDGAEAFLERAGLDRGPWISVGLAAGIGLWFLLDTPLHWLAALGGMGLFVLTAWVFWRGRPERARLLSSASAMSIALAVGLILVWSRSEMIGMPAIDHPRVERLDARVLEREERTAQGRVRLVLAARDQLNGRAIKVRVNVPLDKDDGEARESARIRLTARLLPPASPILPGAYDFARAAWFDGLTATGTLIGKIELVEAAEGGAGRLARIQRSLSEHVRSRLDGSPGAIAAAFASGDRGAIAVEDEAAMRDSGLTHLLSISGLHVSAVIAAAYFIALRLLALWPWLVLRIRLPLVAGAIAAGVGIGYTMLTGAEVPTVRSCIGALLVLAALAIGREPLSMRLVAAAVAAVLCLWPESLIGPSFQMSFAAVIAIVALHNAGPVVRFLSPRDESWASRTGRKLAMLFLTGVVIELALTPIVMFHFHRAGLYGAFANVLAIPLVTLVTMPMIALALLFDLGGMGSPFWWMAGQSLEWMLGLARFTAEQPGAVRMVPQMGIGTVLLFVAGGLWLALWRGRARLWGVIPVALAGVLMLNTPAPDILVGRDGRDIGIADQDGRLLVLKAGREYARENLLEISGLGGQAYPLTRERSAVCSDDFCTLRVTRDGRHWVLLIARSKHRVDWRMLVEACQASDIVIADRRLPRACRPRWLKVDRRFLGREGGVAIYLSDKRVDSVAMHHGEHGWWRPGFGAAVR